MDVKVAWRCNTTQYSHSEVDAAGPLYMPSWATPPLPLKPWTWTPLVATWTWQPRVPSSWGRHQLIAVIRTREQGRAVTPLLRSLPFDGKDYEAERKPPITVNNVVSACGKDYMKKSYPGGRRHAFWGRMECGLVLSSVSPWEMIQKEKGVTRGGYCCKWCKGFWKGKMGSSRFLQITSGNMVLQMVLDEVPKRLYNRWVKDRIEFYKRLEPTAPLRDVPLKVDPNPVHRLRFSMSNGLGHVSDAIWNIVLANPEKAGLEGIHNVADKHIQYWVHQGGHPFFFSILHWGSWILLVARWLFCSRGGPRRELIATSLWEPTGWIDRHLPGTDPRPMTGKKWWAASRLLLRRHSFHDSFRVFLWFFLWGLCSSKPSWVWDWMHDVMLVFALFACTFDM